MHCAGRLLATFTLQPLERSEFCQFLIKMVEHTVIHHVTLIYHGSQFMVSSSVSKRTQQEGTNTRYAATRSWYCHHAFLGLKSTCSVLDTAWLQHGFGFILFTLAGEKFLSHAGPVPACFIKASWASMAWLGTMLASFGHVYTANAPSHAGKCWHAFKWQCKRSIRVSRNYSAYLKQSKSRILLSFFFLLKPT